MSLVSRARHPKRPTPNRKPRPEWKRQPINVTQAAKIATEVSEARKQGWAKPKGGFGGQSKSLRAARTIRKLIAEGIVTTPQS